MLMPSIDIMIDLETTGTKAGCCVLALGATSFNTEFNFYDKIWHQSAIRIGLTDDRETLAWWSWQSEEARKEAFSGTKDIHSVLGAFSDWLRSIPAKEVFIWGNGADFDLPILGGAYTKADMKIPWKPFNGRCYRTLKNLYKDVVPVEFVGTKHNALADAQHQARHAHAILRTHFEKNR